MRNRTGHSSNRCKAFSLNQLFARLFQSHSHAVERNAEFLQFPCPAALEMIVKITCSKRSRPCNQGIQRASNRAGYVDSNDSTRKQHTKAKHNQQLVQTAKVLRCFVIRLQNNQLHLVVIVLRKRNCSADIMLASKPEISSCLLCMEGPSPYFVNSCQRG